MGERHSFFKIASIYHYSTSNILKNVKIWCNPVQKNHIYQIVRILVLRIWTDFVFLICEIEWNKHGEGLDFRDWFRIPCLKLMLRFIKFRFTGNVKVRQTSDLIRSIFHVVLDVVCDEFIYFPPGMNRIGH